MNISSKIGVIFLIMIFGVLVGSFFLMVIWNSVIPELFGLPFIGYRQAILLSILDHIMFKPNPTVNLN